MTNEALAFSSDHDRHANGASALPRATASQPGIAWLFENGLCPLTRALFRERNLRAQVSGQAPEIESRMRSRIAELERTVATLRAEVDRRTTAERDLIQARTAAEAASAAKGAFLANMSHEIRTPMNGIIGMASLLRTTTLTAEQADLVQTLCQSGDSLLTIINDILDFSKIEAGRLTLETIDFDLAEELQLAIELHAEAATKKGIELIMDIDPAVPARVCGDPVRLRQIVLNLVSNAVKFTERGEVGLNVRLERAVPGGVRLHFGVTDTGIGISAAAQASLFQPFVQADTTTTRRFGGTGLGLVICQRLARLMGGEIGVISSEGAGSTFWFNVELTRAQSGTPLPSAASSQLDGRRVLVVDDNATNRKLFGHLANAWGMSHRTADSAEAALRQLREAARTNAPVELVLLDHHMADIDGPGLARAILTDPAIPHPTIVMLTSRGERLVKTEMDTLGIAACELKPIHPKKLHATLGRVMAAAPTPVRKEAQPTIALPPSRPLAGARLPEILVVEDNAVCQKVMLLHLLHLGCTPDLATNASDALAALRRKSYDVVLMDQRMPEMSGAEAVRAIRAAQAAREPGFPRKLHVVAVSASALPHDREACLAAGMDAHLAKPVTPDALQKILARFTGA